MQDHARKQLFESIPVGKAVAQMALPAILAKSSS